MNRKIFPLCVSDPPPVTFRPGNTLSETRRRLKYSVFD
jgi:hypothetical protein